jgi:CRP-like cAMP-binding protein
MGRGNMENYDTFTNKILSLIPHNLKERCKIVTYKKGDRLVEMQTTVQFIDIIVEGSFHVINEFESGRSYEPLGTYESDFIGVVEAITNTNEYFANVRAKQDSKVIRMERPDFMNWINSSHAAMSLVLESVCKNFKLTMQHSGEEMVLNSMYIFVRHLLRTSIKLRGVFLLDEGREITSQRTGINIRTMYRHINKLKELGYVSIEKRRISYTESQKELLLTYYEELRSN